MRSVRRKNKPNSLGWLKVVIPLFAVVLVFLCIKLTTKYWNGRDKFAFTFQNPSGEVGIVVLDPLLNEKTLFLIPGNTQVDVAHGYGVLGIKNVWQLGINEKLSGDLLAQTLTKNFLFPLSLWTDSNPEDTWRFIFNSKNTNIPFGDRLAAGFYMLKTSDAGKTEINLATSQFIRKQKLTDGTLGYVISGPISGRLTAYFADNVAAGKKLRFGIVDSSASYGLADKIGQILEVLGGKVVSVDKREVDKQMDCEISGKDLDIVKKVAILLSCKRSSDNSSFDLEIKIGSNFAKRF